MTTYTIYENEHKSLGRIEQRGAWFVAFDETGKRIGAKKGLLAAAKLVDPFTTYTKVVAL